MSIVGFEFSTAVLVAAAAGSVGTLAVEHGWGWVLAQYHARKARAQEQAGSVFAEVEAAIGPFKGRLAKAEAAISALQAKFPQ